LHPRFEGTDQGSEVPVALLSFPDDEQLDYPDLFKDNLGPLSIALKLGIPARFARQNELAPLA
jgi:hypothetical protein